MIGLRKAQNEALVTDTSTEKKQLAEEPHLLQTSIKKAWPVSLSRLIHKTPSFEFVTFRDAKEIYLYDDPTESTEPNVKAQ